MGENSKIQWTNHTFNPWIGCVKVSDGCAHCYAEAQNKRWGRDLWGVHKQRLVTSDAYWRQPYKWNRDAEDAGLRRRVFCASMADVFEDRDDLDEHRIRLFNLISYTPALDWLLLTKRPQHMSKLIAKCWGNDPLPTNVWLGTTAENQKAADERIPHLLKTSASVRFLSCEPLLGPVDLRQWLSPLEFGDNRDRQPLAVYNLMNNQFIAQRVDWVIAGGESGPGARPMQIEWARRMHEQCASAGVAFFMKQLGGAHNKRADINEFPADLQVREFPSVRKER